MFEAAQAPGALAGRIVILSNPASGTHQRARIEEIARRLEGAGREINIIESAAPGHIRDVARAIDADAVLVAGGDGAVSEAAAGLLDRPAPRPVLGVIPQGTANVLGYELGLPRRADALARVFLRNKRAPLHVGRANGRPFVLMASAGFDAEAVRAINPYLKRKIGAGAYLLAAVKLLFGYRNEIRVKTEREELSAQLAIVTNAKRYGGDFVIAPEAGVHQPGLTLLAVARVSPLALGKTCLALVTGRLSGDANVRRLAVTRVELTSADDVAAQIDGDAFGSLPLVVTQGDETLEILVP